MKDVQGAVTHARLRAGNIARLTMPWVRRSTAGYGKTSNAIAGAPERTDLLQLATSRVAAYRVDAS
jgi:hypothetical protein